MPMSAYGSKVKTSGADYEKIQRIANSLFGCSPIQLSSTTARRLALNIAQQSLKTYRAQCRAVLAKKGWITK
jgi:hypothetical protein